MITSPARYAYEKVTCTKLKERNDMLRITFQDAGKSGSELEKIMQPFESEYKRVNDAIKLYERLRKWIDSGYSIPIYAEDLGPGLVLARYEKNITQSELAKKLGVGNSTPAQKERVGYKGASLEILVRTARALELPTQFNIIFDKNPDTKNEKAVTIQEKDSDHAAVQEKKDPSLYTQSPGYLYKGQPPMSANTGTKNRPDDDDDDGYGWD